MSRTTSGQPRSRPIAQLFIVLLVSLFTVLAACGGSGGKNHKNPVPMLTSVAPTSAAVGGTAFSLTVNGSGFVVGSTVNWNGTARTTTYVGSTQLTAAIAAADLASAGTAQVTVVSPTPGGGISSAATFTITNVAPVAISLSPSSIVAGSGAFDLTVSGSGFVQGTTVQWNGATRTTTFVSGSAVKAAIAAADVATAGTAQVRVVNPVPGGGASSTLTFTVQTAAPVLTSLSPSSVRAGTTGFDLVVNGTGFVQGCTVQWGGTSRATTFVSATQVRGVITAADVANAGAVAVTVLNPEPSAGPSNALRFNVTIVPPQPPLPPPVSSTPVLISAAPDGSPANGPSVNGGMDLSGRFHIFASKASNLVPGDTNDAWDIYMRDTCIDVWGEAVVNCVESTQRILLAADGSLPNGDSGWTATSPEHSLAVGYDAQYVAFVSAASNLVPGDTNGVDDVFISERCIGPSPNCPLPVRVSVRWDGSQSTMPASYPAIAEGGRYVFFVSADPLIVAGDNNGAADVFMRDTCRNVVGACMPYTTRISVAADGSDANGASGSPVFTGRYVAFTSAAANLVAGDTNGVADVFLRDTCIGVSGSCFPITTRISVGTDGAQADGESSEPCVGMPMSSWEGFDYHGRFVVFVSSASNLVPGDTNGVADVFMRDTCRGRTDCVPSTKRISLTSTGQQIIGQPSLQPGHMRWDGEVVLFVTAANGVVPEDSNGFADVFTRVVCHGGANCIESTNVVSRGEGGIPGNGASHMPRGNYDAWVGPEYVTFVSDATNFLTGSVPTPYYGNIFRTTAY
jgi:hypothetical protein